MCDILNPAHIPTSPPIVLKMIEAIENALSPQSNGTAPPIVDPTNTPPQINDFADMA